MPERELGPKTVSEGNGWCPDCRVDKDVIGRDWLLRGISENREGWTIVAEFLRYESSRRDGVEAK